VSHTTTGAAAPDPRALREAVERVPFLHGLPPDKLDALAASLQAHRYRRGDLVFRRGDPGDALYIVLSGRVRIWTPSEADDGAEAILATLRPGEFFGSLALLDGEPRSASATAVEETEALILPRDRFRQLLNDEPAIRDHVLAMLAAEVRRLTSHVEELHFLDITGRLASLLARLAEEQGRVGDDGLRRLAGPITQGELASMAGSTRQSVNKVLGYFTDDGLIRVERDAIVILDLDGLVRASRR
jgi:CRP-like cAMP-binding protein